MISNIWSQLLCPLMKIMSSVITKIIIWSKKEVWKRCLNFISKIIKKFTKNSRNQSLKTRINKLGKREAIRIKVMIQIRNKRKEKRIKKGKERILIPLLNHNYQKVLENQIRKIKIKKKMENEVELNHLNGSLQSNK